jgi:hypothetical protein
MAAEAYATKISDVAGPWENFLVGVVILKLKTPSAAIGQGNRSKMN